MILIDTGPLVALCDARDSRHARALAEIDRIGARTIVALSAVLCEACFLLETQALRARLREILAKVEMNGRAEEHEPAFRESVFEWLDRYSDQQPDFADACLAIASGWERSVEVWTFDGEFTTTWRRPDGSRIPLALGPPSRKRKRRTRR
jgi:predicted nucleic acid-binding protein